MTLLLLGLALGSLHTKADVVLSWEWPYATNGLGFRMFWGLSPGKYEFYQEAGLALTTTVGNLYPGATYYFMVAAHAANGEKGDPSNEVYATITIPPPIRLKVARQTDRVLVDVEYATMLNTQWNVVGRLTFTNSSAPAGFFRAKTVR